MLQLQGTAHEQPPEFLCRARRPLSSNWAPTGIALPTENSWIPEVHGSLNSRSGQEHGNPPSPTSLGQWVCCPGFPLCPIKKKRQNMKTRAVASPSTAGGRSLDQSRRNPGRSVETLVHGWKLETCIGALLAGQRLAFIDQPEPDQILLTSLGLLSADQIYWHTIYKLYFPWCSFSIVILMLLLIRISIVLEEAGVYMNQHESKPLDAKDETPGRGEIAGPVPSN